VSLKREKKRLMHLIRNARIEQNLSQATLAKLANVTQGRIAQIENDIGNISFDVLLGIGRALEL
jgi:transcriptional regulator with XRE-family HTH domain